MDKPDHIIQIPATKCEHCHEDLSRGESESDQWVPVGVGAKAYAALQTILATAKQKAEDAFQTLPNLMETPVCPFVEALSPGAVAIDFKKKKCSAGFPTCA